MKKLMLAVGPVCRGGSAFAAKPREELKAEIDAKIKANGVPAYTLEIVDKGSVTDKKVVGTCDGGTKEIVSPARLMQRLRRSSIRGRLSHGSRPFLLPR